MYCVVRILLFFFYLWASVRAIRGTVNPKTTRSTGATSQQFQIQSSGYNKCIMVSVTQFSVYGYRPTKKTALVWRDCTTQSSGQYWRWTPSGKLVSTWNQQCLAVTRVWRGYFGFQYGVAMQPCNSAASYREWVCNNGSLKLKNFNLYLVPFDKKGSYGVQVRQIATNIGLWTRYGTFTPVCQHATQTTQMPTTQVTSTGKY